MLTQLHLFTLLYGTILAAWCVGFAIIIWRNVRLDAMMARSNETVKVLRQLLLRAVPHQLPAGHLRDDQGLPLRPAKT